MSNCPYCKREAPAEIAQPLLLSPRRRKIYSAVAAAGPDGASSFDLIKAVYGEQEPPAAAGTILRVQVHELNRTLKLLGQRIVSNHCRGYTLVASS
jgi:hypothetical protein